MRSNMTARQLAGISIAHSIKTYYTLAKPGIVMGNAITAIGGFALAAKGHVDYLLLLATLFGLSCIIGSACAFNNYMDRGIDAKMARTKNRALVTGQISPRRALVFASSLVLLGTLVLSLTTNWLAVFTALFGFFVYVMLYTVGKSRTGYATVIGSIAGGAPPAIGYCAVSDRFDLGALLLYGILVLWQMPHFYAITMYRFTDYAAASLPVLPVRKGMHTTKVRMLVYVVAFMVVAPALTLYGYTGYAYFAVAVALSFIWLLLGVQGFKSDNDKLWSRKMFLWSLVVITALFITMALDVKTLL